MNNINYQAIFLIGAQGSGKGVQGKRLASKLGFFYWEMGAILREIAKGDSPLAKIIADEINRGHLLSDEELLAVIKDEFSKINLEQGIIFDGVPRRLGQAEFLLQLLKEKGFEKFATLYLNVPHDVSVERLLERAHHEFRKDDTAETISYRLKIYDKETLPVLDYLKSKSDFFEIDGTPNIDGVTELINQALHLS